MLSEICNHISPRVFDYTNFRDDSSLAHSQWETSLQSNAVSHWLDANLRSANEGGDWTGPFVVDSFFFNSLWPTDSLWQQKSGSTLAPVMACCLTAPSHYLNQCWFPLMVLCRFESNSIVSSPCTRLYNEFENSVSKMIAKSQGDCNLWFSWHCSKAICGYVLLQLYIIHSGTSMIADDDDVAISRHQGICNHHVDYVDWSADTVQVST